MAGRCRSWSRVIPGPRQARSPESIATVVLILHRQGQFHVSWLWIPAQAALGRNDERRAHDSIFTYSKSPGLLSMPTLGGAIHEANLPASLSGSIRLAIKSPSSVEGSHSLFRLPHVASSISTPSGVACTSLNSPIWRWKATFGSVSL